MKIGNTYDFFNRLRKDDLSFIYQGNFSDRITSMVIRLIENNISGGFSKLKNKISFLMIESFQNIIRHGDSLEAENIPSSPGLFLTRCIGDTYYITSANLIENVNVDPLREKLMQVNVLDKDGLKDLYFEILSNKQISSKGGAGLGLIQMSRKSGQKLDFDFVKVSDTLSFFYFQMKLRSSEDLPPPPDNECPISFSKDFHTTASEENIFLIHKGSYSQESIRPVLRMVETNIQDQSDQYALQKISFHILVEILQNISRHGAVENGEREGIFLMGHEDNHYMMSTGNFVENAKVPILKQQIDHLNTLSKPDLHKLYKQTLREGKITEGGGAGLGLIDVVRESSSKVEYELIEIDEHKSFFSLLATV